MYSPSWPHLTPYISPEKIFCLSFPSDLKMDQPMWAQGIGEYVCEKMSYQTLDCSACGNLWVYGHEGGLWYVRSFPEVTCKTLQNPRKTGVLQSFLIISSQQLHVFSKFW